MLAIKKIRSEFLLVVLGRLVTALIAVASLRVMTSLLEPSEYGQWVLLVAFQTFCGLFLINPVDQHVFRHAHAWWDEGNFLGYLRNFDLYIKTISILIIGPVFIWSFNSFTTDSNRIALAIVNALVIGMIVYAGTWNTMFVAFLNVFGFRVESVIWMVTSSLVGLACSSLLVMQYPHGISWICGQAMGAAVGALGARRSLSTYSKKTRHLIAKIEFKDFLNISTAKYFCLPLAAATGFMWLQNTGYRFWVGGVWGAAELGILVVGLGVSAQLTAVIESLAMQFLYPYMARGISDAKSEKQIGIALSDLMNVLWPIYAIWAGFNALFAASLLVILTDSRYHIAIPFVIFGAIIEFTRCTTNLWSNTARAVRRTKGLISPYGLGAISVLISSFLAAHFQLSLIGLAYLLVVSGLITCGSMIFLMNRLLPLRMDIKRILLGIFLMLVSFLLSITAPIKFNGLHDNIVVLLLGSIIFGLLMMAMIWRNSSLDRLLSESLRKK